MQPEDFILFNAVSRKKTFSSLSCKHWNIHSKTANKILTFRTQVIQRKITMFWKCLHLPPTWRWMRENGCKAWEKDAWHLYLLGSPGPSPLKMTECHPLPPVTSRFQSSDFPEPGSWWTACPWGYPHQTLGGKQCSYFTLQGEKYTEPTWFCFI